MNKALIKQSDCDQTFTFASYDVRVYESDAILIYLVAVNYYFARSGTEKPSVTVRDSRDSSKIFGSFTLGLLSTSLVHLKPTLSVDR